MPNTFQETVPVYTGNNVYIWVNQQLIGLVETLSITRAINRRPAYQVGGPLYADAPATQGSVSVSMTNLVPLQGVSGAGVPLSQLGITPNGSLVSVVNQTPFTVDVTNQLNGSPVYSVINAQYNNDAVQVPNTDMFTLSLSLIAQDTQSWT